MSSEPKPATKLVEIRLAALTRVEYTEVVEVPADITEVELDALVDERYENVDGGEFVDDPEYWARGTCVAVDCELPNAAPTVTARRIDGGLQVQRADEASEHENHS